MNESPEIGEITVVNSLALTAPTPLTEHPSAVYLAALSPGSRSAMRQSLNAIARILTSNECDALTLNWAELFPDWSAHFLNPLLLTFFLVLSPLVFLTPVLLFLG